MRTTNSIIRHSSPPTARKNLPEMYRVQETVTSGKRMLRASDDLPGAATSMEPLRTVDSEQRQGAAIEIESPLKQPVTLGGDRLGESYLFGGTGAAVAPLDTTDHHTGLTLKTVTPTVTTRIHASTAHSVNANHDARYGFEDCGVLSSLEDMAAALRMGDLEAVIASASDVDAVAFVRVQDLPRTVGEPASSLEIIGANLDPLEAGLQVLKSHGHRVEVKEAITELISRQTTYQAALVTTSRVLSLTLTDYLQ